MTRKRRGRGEGGYWVRKDGRHVVSVSLGYGTDGKRIRRYAYGSTKAEAFDAAAELRAGIVSGDVAPTRLTLGAYLDEWIKAKTKLRVTTRARYGEAIAAMKPIIGHVRLTRVRPIQIQTMYTILAGRDSKRMPSLCHEVLRAALNQAVKTYRYIKSNPCHAVEKPGRPERELRTLTREELGRFMDAVGKVRLGALCVTAALVGARKGELLALRWDDIDLKKGTMRIQRTLIEMKKIHEPMDTKTKKSKRLIELPARVVAVLKEHRKRMFAEGFAAAPVFCGDTGKFLWRRSVDRWSLDLCLKAAGLPKIRFHDLRHGLATYLLEDDTHPKKVADLLGHASTKTTLEIYSHVTPPQMKDVATRIDAIADGCQSAVKVDEEVS